MSLAKIEFRTTWNDSGWTNPASGLVVVAVFDAIHVDGVAETEGLEQIEQAVEQIGVVDNPAKIALECPGSASMGQIRLNAEGSVPSSSSPKRIDR